MDPEMELKYKKYKLNLCISKMYGSILSIFDEVAFW